MTAALLKQARDAMQAQLDRYVRGVESGDWGFWNPEEEPEVIACRAAIAALDAHAALSPYDQVLRALAPRLPKATTHIQWFQSGPNIPRSIWAMATDAAGRTHGLLCLSDFNIPDAPEGDSGLRRIVHNQDGTSVVEG